jgi:hypothetical protein
MVRDVELAKAARLQRRSQAPEERGSALAGGLRSHGPARLRGAAGRAGVHGRAPSSAGSPSGASWCARQRGHPSIAGWIPLNESWGVQGIAERAEVRAYARALVEVARALDPTRPVVGNDGWETVGGDFVCNPRLRPGRDCAGGALTQRRRCVDRRARDGWSATGRQARAQAPASSSPPRSAIVPSS